MSAQAQKKDSAFPQRKVPPTTTASKRAANNAHNPYQISNTEKVSGGPRPLSDESQVDWVTARYGYDSKENKIGQKSETGKKSSTATQTSFQQKRLPVKAAVNTNSPTTHKTAKATAKLSPVNLVSRIVIWTVNLLFFNFQLLLIYIFIGGLGFFVASEILYIQQLLDFIGSDVDLSYIYGVPLILIVFLGWANLFVVYLIFFITRRHSLSGAHSHNKVSRFFAALCLYGFPIINFFPWVFIWSNFVLKHPR